MNQQCKVCGERAAGFHFGAFTCEGCKSFFGRSYNNLNTIQDCKNGGSCVINKKNRTTCKACRLRKCLLVGMSKSGSRYGRRSNWFKIHCLLQEQNQLQLSEQQAMGQSSSEQQGASGLHPLPSTNQQVVPTPEMMAGELEGSKTSSPLSVVSSFESRNTESSVEVTERGSCLSNSLHSYREPPNNVGATEMFDWARSMMNARSLIPYISHPAFIPSTGLTVLSPYHLFPHTLLGNMTAATNHRGMRTTESVVQKEQSAGSKSDEAMRIRTVATDSIPDNDNFEADLEKTKMENASRFVLGDWRTQRDLSAGFDASAMEDYPPQENPIDLSLKRKRSNDVENTVKSEERPDEVSPQKKCREDPIDLSVKQ